MIVAVAALSLMDGGLKTLSPYYSPLQVTSIRGLSAMPITLAWIAATGGFGQLLRVRFRLHLLRGAIGIASLSLFTYGIRGMPLADVYTIFFVAPLFITALAALILHERVDRRRWVAIGVGFAGVLIVLRPSGATMVSGPGIAILVTAAGYAVSAITVRILGRTDSSQSMVFWLMTFIAVGAGVLAWPSWKPIAPAHWSVIGGIAVSGSIGQWAITEAFKRAEASFIAPFEYTALAWGVGMDWFIWGTVPSLVTFAGAAVVIGSGLYLIRRERVTHAPAT